MIHRVNAKALPIFFNNFFLKAINKIKISIKSVKSSFCLFITILFLIKIFIFTQNKYNIVLSVLKK